MYVRKKEVRTGWDMGQREQNVEVSMAHPQRSCRDKLRRLGPRRYRHGRLPFSSTGARKRFHPCDVRLREMRISSARLQSFSGFLMHDSKMFGMLTVSRLAT